MTFILYLTHHSQVPVIVVFTKYDQFLRNVEMYLSDYPDEHPAHSDVSEVAKKQFQEHYLDPLGKDVRYVRLESRSIIKCLSYMLMFSDRDAQAKHALQCSY